MNYTDEAIAALSLILAVIKDWQADEASTGLLTQLEIGAVHDAIMRGDISTLAFIEKLAAYAAGQLLSAWGYPDHDDAPKLAADWLTSTIEEVTR